MNYGHQWFVFLVGFLYGVVFGGVVVCKALGW